MALETETLQTLLNISTNIFLEVDGSGRVLYASSKAAYIFHASPPEGKNLRRLLDSKNAELLAGHLKSVLYQNYPETFTLEFQTRWYNVFIYPHNGKAVCCLEDITERRQLSHHLHQSRQRLEFAERTARLGYWELDLHAKKFYWSAEMYRIFDIDAAKISTKRNLIREQLLHEDFPLYKQKITELLKFGHPVEGQVRVKRSNGQIAYCLFKASLVYDTGGERIAGTFQDISSLIEIQLALEKARQEADRLNLAKSYFLAQASHDLRQPMQALNMFIAALCEDKLNPEQMDIVKKIEASAANLKSLLDNLLDISKLDSGGMDFQPQSFDLAALLNSLCQEYRQTACLDNFKLRCNLHSITIFSDPLLIERIVRNLLSNAFKYARNTVKISCFKGGKYIYITVSDNGIGIHADEQKQIFDEFYQSRNIPDNRRKGAGLGLNIVKKIAGILGAEIKVRSCPGRYTVFSLRLQH